MSTLPTPLGPSGAPVSIDAQNIPGDWLIGADGNCVIANGDAVQATGLASIGQACQIALLSVLGEWFLDETDGVDWYGTILVKDPNLVAIRAILINTILSVLGIKDVLNLDLQFNQATRRLSVPFTADTDFGELILTVEQA